LQSIQEGKRNTTYALAGWDINTIKTVLQMYTSQILIKTYSFTLANYLESQYIYCTNSTYSSAESAIVEEYQEPCLKIFGLLSKQSSATLTEMCLDVALI
jgi:hypothetical protein